MPSLLLPVYLAVLASALPFHAQGLDCSSSFTEEASCNAGGCTASGKCTWDGKGCTAVENQAECGGDDVGITSLPVEPSDPGPDPGPGTRSPTGLGGEGAAPEHCMYVGPETGAGYGPGSFMFFPVPAGGSLLDAPGASFDIECKTDSDTVTCCAGGNTWGFPADRDEFKGGSLEGPAEAVAGVTVACSADGWATSGSYTFASPYDPQDDAGITAFACPPAAPGGCTDDDARIRAIFSAQWDCGMATSYPSIGATLAQRCSYSLQDNWPDTARPGETLAGICCESCAAAAADGAACDATEGPEVGPCPVADCVVPVDAWLRGASSGCTLVEGPFAKMGEQCCRRQCYAVDADGNECTDEEIAAAPTGEAPACDATEGPEAGPCPVASCVVPTNGCSLVAGPFARMGEQCCRRMCYAVDADGNECTDEEIAAAPTGEPTEETPSSGLGAGEGDRKDDPYEDDSGCTATKVLGTAAVVGVAVANLF